MRTNSLPIVITGMGAISPAGSGVDALWREVCKGKGLARLFTPAGSREEYPACPIPIHQCEIEPDAALRRQDRHAMLAGVAALEASRQARLNVDAGARPDPTRVGLVWGTSRGPISIWDDSWQDAAAGRRPRPTLVPAGTLAAAAGALSIMVGARGPVECVSSACASGAHAIAAAARIILSGEADVVLAGASDAVLSRVTLAQFRGAGLLALDPDPTRACRPFDRGRSGTVFGEGAGAVVLESHEHATNRGMRPLARLGGWGLSADARGRIDPDADGDALERAITAALAMAGVRPPEIGYANLHGTGTIANDASEAGVVRRVFQGCRPLCGSTKGVTGHCVGATAALEAIIAIRSITERTAPPSANLDDTEFDLEFVRGTPRPFDRTAALSTSSGFWGLNACLVFARA